MKPLVIALAAAAVVSMLAPPIAMADSKFERCMAKCNLPPPTCMSKCSKR